MKHITDLETLYLNKLSKYKESMLDAKNKGDFDAFRYYSYQFMKYHKAIKALKRKVA